MTTQEKERQAWERGMQKRQELIRKIKKHGIKKGIDLNQMSLKALKEILEQKECKYKAWRERQTKRDGGEK